MQGQAIFVGIGGNLPSVRFGAPPASFVAALDRLSALGVVTVAVSRWYCSDPLPPSAQPAYINGVAAVQSRLEPVQLLAALHATEAEFGRVRRLLACAVWLDAA